MRLRDLGESWVIIMCGLLVGVLLVMAIKDAHDWPVYRQAHSCLKTGKSETSVITTLISTGDVTVPIITPVTTYEWSCDNGSVWR